MELQKPLLLLLFVSIGISLNAQQWTKSDLSERSSIDNDYLPEKIQRLSARISFSYEGIRKGEDF